MTSRRLYGRRRLSSVEDDDDHDDQLSVHRDNHMQDNDLSEHASNDGYPKDDYQADGDCPVQKRTTTSPYMKTTIGEMTAVQRRRVTTTTQTMIQRMPPAQHGTEQRRLFDGPQSTLFSTADESSQMWLLAMPTVLVAPLWALPYSDPSFLLLGCKDLRQYPEASAAQASNQCCRSWLAQPQDYR